MIFKIYISFTFLDTMKHTIKFKAVICSLYILNYDYLQFYEINYTALYFMLISECTSLTHDTQA